MQPVAKQFTCIVGNRPITFETGKLAGQAGGAVTIRLGDSIIFAAATMGNEPKQDQDFFPLTVEYEERMYAGGRIPGSFFRREGRPGTEATLIARLTDRPIRPLFNKDMRNEVQVVTMSISADKENPLDILVINAASAALMVSDIPWGGPVGAVRVAMIDGKFIINPTHDEMEKSTLDLRIAGTRDAILMVECGAVEVPEDIMVKALTLGHEALQPLIDAQLQLREECGKPKREVTLYPLDEELYARIDQRAAVEMDKNLEKLSAKVEINAAYDALEKQVIAEFAGEDETKIKPVKQCLEEVYKRVVRQRILDGHRPDKRSLDQVRPIWCEVGTSPRAHGSAIFTRGETQVFTMATLGTPSEAQEIDSLSPMDSKRYIHHYNFPPYSTGETKRMGGQSRREIGHGALAERALEPVIPAEKEFPYTIRLVSEVLSSNGSSSMASVCGSTLALMDTGVPIKAPVSGVAMGLIKEGDRFAILTDIMGIEDHLGDMDFKVAGTKTGITALQMDIKIKGITPEIMSKALSQAHTAREHIMSEMLAVIPVPNPELKPHTPRVTVLKIPVDKIGAIIGPGGKNIRALQEETHTKIDIEDDGTVYIAAIDGEGESAARDRIEATTESAQVGRIYTGKVVRVTDFGAFIEILPNTDGMVHISQLDSERVEKVEDIANVGDSLTVMVTNIDPDGKIRLSRQAVLEGWTPEQARENDSKRSGGRPSGGGGQRPGGGRPPSRDSGRGPSRGGRDNRR
jgi:polyribonucleotide nucleotidyltransferase